MNNKTKEALEAIGQAATANRIQYEFHARQRMRERGVSREDVRKALIEARKCQASKGERWKVTGPDLDDEELTVVLVIEGDLINITAF